MSIVLDEAWTLFTRFFLRFFVIALVVSAISSDNDGAAFALAILALATVVVGTTWLQGAVVAPFSAIAIAITYFRLRDAQAPAAVPAET